MRISTSGWIHVASRITKTSLSQEQKLTTIHGGRFYIRRLLRCTLPDSYRIQKFRYTYPESDLQESARVTVLAVLDPLGADWFIPYP